MAYNNGPTISTNGLVLMLDAGNRKSYAGSGTTWNDLSGNGNTGTLTNGPTFNGGNNGSIVFDGVDDYVTLGNDKFKYQDNFTVEVWAKFSNVPNNAGSLCGASHPIIYNHDYGYNLLIGSNGKVNWNLYNTSGTAANISSVNSVVGSNYFHAVGTKSGTTVSLYVNAVLQGTGSLTTNAMYYIAQPFVIGGFGLCGGQRFYATGNVASVKVYNTVLSAQEILQNFNATRGRFGV